MRDRIVDFRRVPAGDLAVNSRNFRTHPEAQREALRGLLKEVGIADALLAYHSERDGGRLTLIDGELRKTDNPDALWPVLITDLNDAEADLMLSTLDPLSAMAGTDAGKLDALLHDVTTDDAAVQEMLSKLAEESGIIPPDVEFKEFDESVADEVKYHECPQCGHKFPA